MTKAWPHPTRLHMASSRLPVEGHLPSLDGATGWLNSLPLTAGGLAGKTVLVSFWTYTCINWLRQLPYLRAWAAKYEPQGLVVLGVHTPEFGFERDVANVTRAVRDMAIGYPVAVDSDYRVWNAFRNHYWPALYFADAEGRLRHHYYGEGEYAQSEMVIQQLLTEAGAAGVRHDLVSPDGASGLEAPADWASLLSPENYTGSDRTEGFASPGGIVPGQRHTYIAPADLRRGQWALSGDWTVSGQAATAASPGATVTCRFHARDLHMVLGPGSPGASAGFRVLLDGQPPGDAHGGDTGPGGAGTLTQQRLHQLIRQPGPVADRTFEITFQDEGAEAYAFTFG